MREPRSSETVQGGRSHLARRVGCRNALKRRASGRQVKSEAGRFEDKSSRAAPSLPGPVPPPSPSRRVRAVPPPPRPFLPPVPTALLGSGREGREGEGAGAARFRRGGRGGGRGSGGGGRGVGGRDICVVGKPGNTGCDAPPTASTTAGKPRQRHQPRRPHRLGRSKRHRALGKGGAEGKWHWVKGARRG